MKIIIVELQRAETTSFDVIDTTLICSTTLDVQRPCYRTENIDACKEKSSEKAAALIFA